MKVKCNGKFVEKHFENGKTAMVCELCGMKNSHKYFIKPHTIQMSDRQYEVDKNGTYRRKRA